MPQTLTRLGFLGALTSPICLFCRSHTLPRARASIGAIVRNISISSTSIKASLPTAEKDEKSAIADGLAELARVGFANEGRVRLAMRGLEGQDAGVRVAVLGRSGSEGRLVAVLLADPLSTEPEEETRWTEDILSWSSSLREGKGGALLIRYGPPSKITTPAGSPISLLSVPSPLLKSSALEILLAPLLPTSEDLAVITLQATEVPGARIIEYPVHKTLFWAGEGPDGLSMLLGQRYTSTGPVMRALSLPTYSSTAPGGGDVKIIDLGVAEDAITQWRKLIGNTSILENGLVQSGIEKIQGWIVAGTSKSKAKEVKPAIKELAFSIISEAEFLIQKEEGGIIAAQKALENRISCISSFKADNMDTLSVALKSWSQTAHSELQDGLNAAFKSKTWNGLAWWKLIWAADSVTQNSCDVLAAGFLPESKKKLLFLAGRFSGAGYRGGGKGGGPTSTPASVEEELAEIRKSDITMAPQTVVGNPDYCPPFIFRAKNSIIENVIPRLQASANRLLIHSLSLSASGILVSAMLYASEVSIYSSSSAAAFGLAYGARSLQKKWGKEKRWFQDSVTEHGRVAIAKTERWGWERLEEGLKVEGHEAIEDVYLKRIENGKKAVGGIRRALRDS